MKSNMSPLLFTAIALLSASGSIAYSAQSGTTGCTDGSCWGSCFKVDNDHTHNGIDTETPWEEGGDWCWLTKGDNEKSSGYDEGGWDWVTCESEVEGEHGCSFDNGYHCNYQDPDACSA